MPRGRPKKVKEEQPVDVPKKKGGRPKKNPEVKPVTAAPTVVPSGMNSVTKLVKEYSFNVLGDDNDDIVTETREALQAIQSRRKNCPTGFRTMAEIQRSMIPYRHFYVQWALGSYGIPEGTVMEIIGAEHLGKSTFCFWIMGGAMERGVPCALQETENKELTVEWAGRALSQNRAVAEKMLHRIGVTRTFALAQMDEQMIDWFEISRGKRPGKNRAVPLDTPMLMVVDSWSKMLSDVEAAGFYDYGDNLSADKKKKAKATGEASNFGHAKFAQAWTRRLPSFLSAHNGVLVMVSHQNDKVEMSGSGSKMTAEAGALYNKTKIGGRALNQNSAIQLIIGRKGQIKDSNNDKYGTTVRVRVEKNSYGPKDRVFEYDLLFDKHQDTDTYLAPNLDFDRPMCDFFAEQGILQTTINKKRYSSPVLGLTQVTAKEFSAAFHANLDIRNEVGRALKIRGYENEVDTVKSEIESSPVVVPADAPPPPPEDEEEILEEETLEEELPEELEESEDGYENGY